MTVANVTQLALQHHWAGRLSEAEAMYRQALGVDPNNVDALHLSGVLASQSGNFDLAVSLIRRAIKLNPRVPDFYGNLGIALHEAGKLDEAVASYQKALKLKPDYADAHYNLGNVFKDLGRLDEAASCYQHALAIKPAHVEACNNLGMVSRMSGRPGAAIEHLQRALALRPDYAIAQNNLGNALRDQGRLDEAIDFYCQAWALQPDFIEAHGNLLFTLNAVPDWSPEAVFEEHRNFARMHCAQFESHKSLHPNDRDPQRKLKIGYLSPDFRDHPVASFIEPVLAHHDPARFELFGYSSQARDDDTTARLKQYFPHWRDIGGKSDEQAANLIREDGVDILVDLAGHTAGGRMPVFARKPAPIQVAWIGYPNTTGLSAMDYRFTDGFADPVGTTEKYHTETLLRLPGGFLCYMPPAACPAVAPPPVLRNGHVTFGSFNNFAKVTHAVIGLWADLLRAVPDSRLMIKYNGLDEPAMGQRLLDEFAGLGVGGSRLDLRGRTPSYFAHLQCYDEVDIALDTFPYNGTTTTCEALWMGVPVVVLAGKTHASRVGVSLATNSGLPELVAGTRQQYVEIAASLAAGTDRLAQLRVSLRQRMSLSPLLNAADFTGNIEAAYRTIWQKWCAA